MGLVVIGGARIGAHEGPGCATQSQAGVAVRCSHDCQSQIRRADVTADGTSD
jgi:hypothetical protein